jgi:hypothetical protein
VASRASGSDWGSLLLGLASTATIPVAVYLTRFSESYELLHAGFTIPVAAALGMGAVALARRARRQTSLTLSSHGPSKAAVMGRALGGVGLCMAASALVALGVYGLLEYVGSRD